MRPGEYFFAEGDIEANKGKTAIALEVKNAGDRPIQVGSHYHFFETNRNLKFDRARTLGKRLNIPSGTAVRFEPGQSHTVYLVDLGGTRTVNGFNRLVEGNLDDPQIIKAALDRAQKFSGEK